MKAVDAVADLLGPWIARQRWGFKAEPGSEPALHVEHSEVLLDGPGPQVLWYLVRGDEDLLHQVLVAVRPSADAIDLGERDILGSCETDDGEIFAYDALADPETARAFAAFVGLHDTDDMTVRSVGAEQSNSSVVLGDMTHGDRMILKVYRRVRSGPNPDVEVPAGLDRVGFNHLAAPLAVWHRADYDLAVAQEYLAGGVEGWAMALASLRDLYAGQESDPASAGGDFSSEAHRIGEMTARLHLALAEAFGLYPPDVEAWTAVTMEQVRALGLAPASRRAVEAVVSRVRGLGQAGAIGQSIRVHGDFHLGQVMRTDNGWFVLDFEGEPERSIEERRRPWPALKDVAGMLRSLEYAAGVGLTERVESEREALVGRSRRWQETNRVAFLEGYRSLDGVAALVPEGDLTGQATAELTSYFELDKALYELAYERSHRPDWEWIPLSAIEQLTKG